MMEGRKAVDIPEAFQPVDEWVETFIHEFDSLGLSDEVIRRDVDLVPDDGWRSLWPNASGGVALSFRCDVRNSYGMGNLPKRLTEDAEQKQYEALKAYLGEHPVLSQAVAELTDERRRPALYAYGADKLGKTREQVDHDVAEAVWLLRDELPDSEREALNEWEGEAMAGDYAYGIDIAYLDTLDRGNPWNEEPLVEITLTFTEPGVRTSDDLARRYLTLDACREGANQLLTQWAIGIFHAQ